MRTASSSRWTATLTKFEQPLSQTQKKSGDSRRIRVRDSFMARSRRSEHAPGMTRTTKASATRPGVPILGGAAERPDKAASSDSVSVLAGGFLLASLAMQALAQEADPIRVRELPPPPATLADASLRRLCPPVVAVKEAKRPQQLIPGSAECLEALEFFDVFFELGKVAGFAPRELGFAVLPEEVEVADAFYRHGVMELGAVKGGAVEVTQPLLRARIPHGAKLAVMAHELGHALQDRQGLLHYKAEMKPYDKMIRRYNDPDYHAYSRQLEAMADVLGTGLLAKAGVPASRLASGHVQWLGCGNAAMLASDPYSTHPTQAQRLVNVANATATQGSRDENERGGMSEEEARLLWPSATFRNFDRKARYKPAAGGATGDGDAEAIVEACQTGGGSSAAREAARRLESALNAATGRGPDVP